MPPSAEGGAVAATAAIANEMIARCGMYQRGARACFFHTKYLDLLSVDPTRNVLVDVYTSLLPTLSVCICDSHEQRSATVEDNRTARTATDIEPYIRRSVDRDPLYD